ncbi:(Fe-S)-binding protein [Photobacterium atrarenae]|uniref:(Fe-S)-binding protein n=1 Tax=Photobacterium atrarenae TaxID=865757 RepID=A0ABY5GLA3_9GAMM|nr:(Fe-S)-binding protein [Photobacterium atrarenae]UTV29514.1 (Fe-S)-binding protein [Photobacterium atrarenae]
MVATWITALLWLSLLVMGVGAVRRIRLWRQGRPNPVPFWTGLVSVPRRYLVDLHHVVARDPAMATTHVATAGGFVAAMVLLIGIYLLGLASSFFHVLLLMACGVMLIGARRVARRRRTPLPAHLSAGPWMRLPKSLMVFAVTFVALSILALVGVEQLPWLGVVLLVAVLCVALADLLFGMTWGGPMKHAFAGALHLAFHPRPQRFGGGRSTGLKPLDLSADRLGVEKVTDFHWNQLLGFDACVQCGRCEQACPAFAAGQPLNPKKLVQDLVVGMAGGSTADYAGSPHPGQSEQAACGAPDQPLFASLLDPETVWSCTTCRACVEACPMMIEHVDAVVDLRRHLTLVAGATAGKGPEVLCNLIATDNPNGNPPTHRHNWAVDLNLPLLPEVKQTDVLLWVGDGAFERRNQRTLRALVALLRRAGVAFAVLGNDELDCGDLARRLGDEATFQRLATANVRTLNQYQFARIVTTDPHAFHALKNEYPDFGGHYRVCHHTQLLAELLTVLAADGRLADSPLAGTALTYHDPCYLGRYNGEYDAPRQVLQALGAEIKEMDRSGYRARCCGGGGGAPVTDIPGKQRIPDMRMADVRETGAQLVVVACPQCCLMLEGVVEPRPQVRDVAELLLEVIEALPEPDTPFTGKAELA